MNLWVKINVKDMSTIQAQHTHTCVCAHTHTHTRKQLQICKLTGLLIILTNQLYFVAEQ